MILHLLKKYHHTHLINQDYFFLLIAKKTNGIKVQAAIPIEATTRVPKAEVKS
jgi:hypothetical protein